MGGHYGSVQVRSENRDRVKAVAEQVAREKQIHILIAPPVNGWIALFPEGNGQDDSVGKAVAEQLDEDVLHLLVHDDDIFAYWFYRDRRLIDSYWSAPGYFGEENRAREEKMAGNPELFRPLMGNKVSELAELLNRDAPHTFEHERLESFGKLLGMSNAVNAYEYLKEGERTGIKNWKQFIDVPADQIEEEANQKKQERSRIAAERKRLKAEGLLLQIDERKVDSLPRGCAAGGGFLVAWPAFRTQPGSFLLYSEPWDVPTPVTLTAPNHATLLASDSNGRRIAVTGPQSVSVWDWSHNETWSPVCEMAESNHPHAPAMSADGALLAHASQSTVVVTRIASAERLFTCPIQFRVNALAFHPSREWLVATGEAFGLLAIGEAEPWRNLYVGGKSNIHLIHASILRTKMRAIDLDEFDRQQQAAMAAAISRLAKLATRSKKSVFSDDQIEKMKRDLEKQFAESKQRLVALKEGHLPPSAPQARERVICAGFSRDGRWLWCGTNVGLNVYEWDAVPRKAGADMPPPKWAFDPPGALPNEIRTQVHAIAEVPGQGAIVFGIGTGGLYELELTNGTAREFMMNDRTIHFGLEFSADGKTLATSTCTTPRVETHRGWRDLRRAWSIWSYARFKKSSLPLAR